MAIEGEILEDGQGKEGAWEEGKRIFGQGEEFLERGAQSLVASFTDSLPLR